MDARGSRATATLGVLAALALFLPWSRWSVAQDATTASAPAPSTAPLPARVALGSPACGGTSKAARCHLQLDLANETERGHYPGVENAPRFRELATWRTSGGHARAFERLSGERARVMAEQLAFFESGGKEPADPSRKDPTKRADCLSCHGLVVGLAGDPARAVEGVSCESCHGNAGVAKDAAGKTLPGWIDAHAERGWRERPEAEWTARGMTYTPDLRAWAKKCLECHMANGGAGAGDERGRLTHTLYAAGHPPLSFELVTDLALAPVHFRERVGQEVVPEARAPWFYARLWAVGQVVSLAESMRRLERALRAGPALDLSFMECFACHHALDTSLARRPQAGWRQGTRGFFGTPGEPVLGLESWMTARHVARRLLPKAEFDALVSSIVTVFDAASLRGVKDRDQAAQAAARAAALADDAATRAEQAARTSTKDPAAEAKDALELLREVAADDEVAYYGYRAAEQQARALYALYLVSVGRGAPRPANDAKIRSRLDDLFGQLYTAKREPRPGDFDLAAYQAARDALARELPAR